jgi:hypothetical protein
LQFVIIDFWPFLDGTGGADASAAVGTGNNVD